MLEPRASNLLLDTLGGRFGPTSAQAARSGAASTSTLLKGTDRASTARAQLGLTGAQLAPLIQRVTSAANPVVMVCSGFLIICVEYVLAIKLFDPYRANFQAATWARSLVAKKLKVGKFLSLPTKDSG